MRGDDDRGRARKLRSRGRVISCLRIRRPGCELTLHPGSDERSSGETGPTRDLGISHQPTTTVRTVCPRRHLLKRKGLLSDERIELMNSFSVDTSPTLWPQDSEGLERLGRYMLRCPLSLSRIHWTRGARTLFYQGKAPNDDPQLSMFNHPDGESGTAQVIESLTIESARRPGHSAQCAQRRSNGRRGCWDARGPHAENCCILDFSVTRAMLCCKHGYETQALHGQRREDGPLSPGRKRGRIRCHLSARPRVDHGSGDG